MLEKLGVKKIINASGTLTVLGGNRISKRVVEAISEVSDSFVDMEELSIKAGKYVAKLAGVPAAYITSGAASGLVTAVGSLISKGNLEKMSEMPAHGKARPNIVIQYPHSIGNPYYKLLEFAGVEIRIAGNEGELSPEALKESVDNNTVAIVHFLFEPQPNEIELTDVIKISRSLGIPVVVDAAAELPPFSNLSALVGRGADLVVFSGGKDIGAPSNTGVILSGSADLVEYCRKLGPFSYLQVNGVRRTFIGRVFKVSKEDILAFTAAFEAYTEENHESKLAEMNRNADLMIKRLEETLSGLKARKITMQDWERTRPPLVPRVEIHPISLTPQEICEKLRSSDPPIYAILRETTVQISMHCLNSEEVSFVTDKLVELLS